MRGAPTGNPGANEGRLRGSLKPGGFVRSISSLWAAEAAYLVSAAIQGIVVARALGPSNYGAVALIASYPTLILSFLDTYSMQTTVKFLARFRERGDSAATLAVVRLGYAIDLVFSMIGVAFVALTARWAETAIIKTPGVETILVVYALALVLRSPANTASAVMVSFNRVGVFGLSRGFVAMTRALFVMGVAIAGSGFVHVLWAMSAGLAAEGMVLLAVSYPTAVRSLGRTSFIKSWRCLKPAGREIARFILWTDLSSLLGSVTKQLDILVLGYFAGPAQAGYYRVARGLAGLGGSVVGPLQSLVYPRLSSLIEAGRSEGAQRLIMRSAVFVGLPLGLVGLGVVFLVPAAIDLIVGAEFGPATVPAQLLIIGIAFWTSLFWVRPFVFSVGGVKFWALNSGIVALVSVVAFVLLTPRFGTVGVAAVQLFVGTIATHVGALVYLRRRGFLRWDLALIGRGAR